MTRRLVAATLILLLAGSWSRAFTGVRQAPAPAPAEPGRFRALDLGTLANHPLDWLIKPPGGQATLGGVPFVLRTGTRAVFVTRQHYLPANPATGSLTVDVRGVFAVHALVSGIWVVNIDPGQEIGTFGVVFDDATIVSRPLVNGLNIREGWEYERRLTALEGGAGLRWKNVWDEPQVRGADRQAGRARGFLDMVTLELPSELAARVVANVFVTDNGIVRPNRLGVGQIDPSLALVAVTVQTR